MRIIVDTFRGVLIFLFFLFLYLIWQSLPMKMNAFTVMIELAYMEVIRARGMTKTIMEAWPTVLKRLVRYGCCIVHQLFP